MLGGSPARGATLPAVGLHGGDSLRHVLLQAHAVVVLQGGLDASSDTLSPFERHVALFLDGARTVADVGRDAGLSQADVQIALGMLADKGALALATARHATRAGAPVPRATLFLDTQDARATTPWDEQPRPMALAPIVFDD